MGVIRKVVREGGFNGLFRGLNVTLLREIPGTMIWFVAYELALRCFKQPGHSRNEVSLWGIFSAGAIRWHLCLWLIPSGATYWSLIYPIDTVKSIMQTDPKYSSQIQQGKSRLASTSKYLVRPVRSNVSLFNDSIEVWGWRVCIVVLDSPCFERSQQMPSFFSVMSIQQDCLASSFRVFFVTIFLHSFFRSLFDPMESAPTQLGEPGSIVRSSHKPLNDENEKLSLYKQVCIIGLCKQGDVRFCRVEVLMVYFEITCRMTIVKWLWKSFTSV